MHIKVKDPVLSVKNSKVFDKTAFKFVQATFFSIKNFISNEFCYEK
jgi:hypothetical protein